MFIEMMIGKIHRAIVTEANLNYVGSITIDSELMKAAGLIAHQKVQIVNNNNGARLETYVIEGERNSGVICINGAAARLVDVGDVVIIIGYGVMDQSEAINHIPKAVFLDGKNGISKIEVESAKQNILK